MPRTKKSEATPELTHLDKAYWPDDHITKGDLLRYYEKVAPYILPYLKNRPESLRRNPNGITDQGFFQKDAGHGTPAWVATQVLYSDAVHKDIDYILCNNAPTLLYLANLGCIELNPWHSRVQRLDEPDYMVIDLDPSDNNTFEQVVDTALVVKDILDKAGVTGHCKTSGSTGLHIYVPFKAKYAYELVRSFAQIVVTLVQEQIPDTTTLERSLALRDKGKIYLDYLQNKRGQTLAAPYCVRPRPGAPVSAPLAWKEVKRGLSPQQFNLHNMLKRLAAKGDLFEGVLTGGNSLTTGLKRLGA